MIDLNTRMHDRTNWGFQNRVFTKKKPTPSNPRDSVVPLCACTLYIDAAARTVTIRNGSKNLKRSAPSRHFSVPLSFLQCHVVSYALRATDYSVFHVRSKPVSKTCIVSLFFFVSPRPFLCTTNKSIHFVLIICQTSVTRGITNEEIVKDAYYPTSVTLRTLSNH